MTPRVTHAEAFSDASQRAPDAISTDKCVAASEGKEVRTSELDDVAVAALISFFDVLDRWDREEKHEC